MPQQLPKAYERYHELCGQVLFPNHCHVIPFFFDFEVSVVQGQGCDHGIDQIEFDLSSFFLASCCWCVIVLIIFLGDVGSMVVGLVVFVVVVGVVAAVFVVVVVGVVSAVVVGVG